MHQRMQYIGGCNTSAGIRDRLALSKAGTDRPIDKSQSCPISGSCQKEEKIIHIYYITTAFDLPDV